MSRRLLALIVATVLGFLALPISPAHAALAATAEVTGTTAVYPGSRSFALRVTNNEIGILGQGTSFNAIRVNFPVNQGIKLAPGAYPAPAGWTATATNLGFTQYVTYRGGRVPPASSLSLTLPSTVDAPNAKDLVGDFRVSVSHDNFTATQDPATAPASNPNALKVKVMVLEILDGTLKPVAPTNADNTKGVTDRSGTAGQLITYAYTVKNHAKSAINVSARLDSSNPADVPSAATVASVAGGGSTHQFEPQITLGEATSQRTTTFTANATAPDAVAPVKSDTFTVQVPVKLDFSNITPVRVRSGANSEKTFTVTASKTGGPLFDLNTAQFAFGANSKSASEVPKLNIGANTQTFALTFAFSSVTGADGEYESTVTSAGQDHNLVSYAFGAKKPTPDPFVTIDNLAPLPSLEISLPKDRDGDQQVAVKRSGGDTISVKGAVVGQTTRAGGTDPVQSSLQVQLTPDAGNAVNVSTTKTSNTSGFTYTGSATPGAWNSSATRFQGNVSVADEAGNVGSFQTPGFFLIDGDLPKVTEAKIIEPRKVRVQFADETGIRGGCNPASYTVEPDLSDANGRYSAGVSKVTFVDGSDCASSVLTTNQVRILQLDRDLDQDAVPLLRYRPITRIKDAQGNTVGDTIPLKDGAGNDAAEQTIKTVTDLVPPAPQIISVRRHDGSPSAPFETAYKDGETGFYYGNVCPFEITVNGVRQNYVVEVVDAAGTVIASKKRTAPLPPLSSEAEETIEVPCGPLDGVYARGVRLRNIYLREGATTPFTVVLDTVLPAIAADDLEGDKARATFSEKIVAGTEHPDDWFVSELEATETGTANRTVGASKVEVVDNRNRLLGLANLLNPLNFTKADYFLQSPSGARYEDRAGNYLADTLTPVT